MKNLRIFATGEESLRGKNVTIKFSYEIKVIKKVNCFINGALIRVIPVCSDKLYFNI